MFDGLKFAVRTAAVMALTLIAIGMGAVIVAGLAVAGAIGALVYRSRANGNLRENPAGVVIDAEYYEIPRRTAAR